MGPVTGELDCSALLYQCCFCHKSRFTTDEIQGQVLLDEMCFTVHYAMHEIIISYANSFFVETLHDMLQLFMIGLI